MCGRQHETPPRIASAPRHRPASASQLAQLAQLFIARAAKRAGIPFMTFDRQSATVKPTVPVGGDSYDQAKTIAKGEKIDCPENIRLAKGRLVTQQNVNTIENLWSRPAQ